MSEKKQNPKKIKSWFENKQTCILLLKKICNKLYNKQQVDTI